MSVFTNLCWSKLLQTVAAAACCVCFLTTSASAISDQNENGVSDVWEKLYNSGNLFTTFDPLADPDGDGWTNEIEAISGTNPFDGNPPTGFVRPVIDHIPAVYVTGSGGDPEILTPEAITITWPTLAGKRYTLLSSFDLSEGSWIPIDNDTPRISTGADMANAIPLTQSDGSIPPGVFLRVAISDYKTDEDSLTDYEEILLGTSIYLSDTDGDGIDDGDEIDFGSDPNGDDDGDGVPDKILYSVEFEIRQEFHEMPYGVGHEVLAGTDFIHRYLTLKQSEEYSVSGSAQYGNVSNGEQVWTSTYLQGGTITPDGQQVTSLEGISLDDWKSANHLPSLDEDEYLTTSTTQTAVTGPTTSATEIVTTTTRTTPWEVKKHVPGPGDDTVVRSGVETIIITDRTKLTNPVTYQELWTNYLKPKRWAEWDSSAPSIYGPRNWMDYNRYVVGDAKAAEYVRDNFIYNNFGVSATISSPGSSPIDFGSDNRLKSLRWRWVRFNPLTPFDLEYTAPPDSYQQRFPFLVQQKNFLSSRSGSPPVVTIDEELAKGVVEISCQGIDGAGWHTVDSTKFGTYKLEDPTSQANLNFSNLGYSHVVLNSLLVEFEVKHTEIDPLTGYVVNPGPNKMLRDEIVDIRIKVPPIGATDWTVDLTVEPEAIRNESLPNRGNVQMYDFGQVETSGTVTPDKTQFVLQASSGGERTIKAVFNKEGKLTIKMKSTDEKLNFTSPEYTIQKRIRKYANLPANQNHDLNQHDKAFIDAAAYWGGVYGHQVDDVERLKAMGMAESDLGLTDATDILTIGNPGDHVLDTFRNVPPYDRLPGVTPLGGLALREVDVANNSTRMLSYPAADENPAATAIHWGVCWLYQKASSIQINPNPPQSPNPPNPYIPGPWRSWDNATERYNGGGVSNYLQRINRSMKEGRHPSTADLYIWPIKSNKSARGN